MHAVTTVYALQCEIAINLFIFLSSPHMLDPTTAFDDNGATGAKSRRNELVDYIIWLLKSTHVGV